MPQEQQQEQAAQKKIRKCLSQPGVINAWELRSEEGSQKWEEGRKERGKGEEGRKERKGEGEENGVRGKKRDKFNKFMFKSGL